MIEVLGIHGLFQALPVDYLAQRAANQPGASRDASPEPGKVDRDMTDDVVLSRLAGLLSRTADSVASRVDRIARIRAAIEGGTYETSAKVAVVVDRLLKGLEE